MMTNPTLAWPVLFVESTKFEQWETPKMEEQRQ